MHLIYTTSTCTSQQCHSCNFLMNEQKYLSDSAHSNASCTIIITLSLIILKMNKFSIHCTLIIVCLSFVNVILLLSS